MVCISEKILTHVSYNIPLCKEEEEEENLLFLINASQVPLQVPQKLYSFYKTPE